MRAHALFGFLLLMACSSQSEKAEKRVAMLEQAKASSTELCDAKKAVADAYLAEGKQTDFEQARLYARITCLTADLDRQAGTLY